MKIAIFNYYQKISSRGAETYVRELGKRFSKKHKVDVYFGNKALPKRWPFVWRFFIDPQSILIGLFTFEHLLTIWKEKFDIIFSTNGGWQPALIRLVTWLYGGKIVIPGLSGMGWDERSNLWTFPDLFAAMSPRAKDWAKKAQPLVNSDYVPGGVDIHKFTPKGEVVIMGLKGPVILCVGALTKDKRIDLVIKAVSRLGQVSLIVSGGGELKEDLKDLGKSVLGQRFTMIDELDHDEMPKIYRTADLFTTASVPHSAFELVIVEAMASGLPVVAGDDPIRKKIVGNAGLLANPENTSEYAKALKKALDTNWGNKPRNQAKKYSWDIISEKYEKLFIDLIK